MGYIDSIDSGFFWFVYLDFWIIVNECPLNE